MVAQEIPLPFAELIVARTVNSVEQSALSQPLLSRIDSPRKCNTSRETTILRETVDNQMRRQLGQVFCALVGDTELIDIEEFVGVHRSRVSRLRGGKLAEFSIPWLLRTISRFGYDFTLIVAPRPPATIIPNAPTATVVRHDRFGRVVPNDAAS